MKPPRGNNWIQTFTGKYHYPLDARPEELDIRDIIHGCSLENRYAGQTPLAVSVAQHQCHVFDTALALFGARMTQVLDLDLMRIVGYEALFHDAHEGMGFRDMPAPIKRLPEFEIYRKLSDGLQQVVWEFLGIDPTPESSDLVHEADMILLATEKRDLCSPSDYDWGPLPDPLPVTISPWSAKKSEREMFRRYKLLRSWGVYG